MLLFVSALEIVRVQIRPTFFAFDDATEVIRDSETLLDWHWRQKSVSEKRVFDFNVEILWIWTSKIVSDVCRSAEKVCDFSFQKLASVNWRRKYQPSVNFLIFIFRCENFQILLLANDSNMKKNVRAISDSVRRVFVPQRNVYNFMLACCNCSV